MQTLRRLAVLWIGIAGLAITCFSAGGEHEFRFRKDDAQTVAVVGEFNGWKAQPMTKTADGAWTVKLSLPPGTHGYKFLVDGSEWMFDPENPQRKNVGGVENSAVEVSDKSSPVPARAGATPITKTQLSITSALTPSPTRSRTAVQPTRSKPGEGTPFSVTPGEVTTVDVPLSPLRQTQARREGNPPVTEATVAIGVPAGFDPAGTWPILVISATVDASNIELLGAYKKEALTAGWVVFAADAPEKPKQDSNSWRLAMIGGGLDFMAAQWPASLNWPVACAGFSGGAKRSGYVAASLMKDGRKIIGMFMGGVNQDMATMGLQEYRPAASPFKQVPIFLSSGAKDAIATPAHHERVVQSMKGSGFRKVRLESFPGAHDIYPPHTTEALRWFGSESAPPGASPSPTSSFDTFFRKP